MNMKIDLGFIAKGVAVLGLAIFLFGVQKVQAHPGNTDAYGCHTCRTNCPSWGLYYGEYHCHNTYSAPVYNPAPIYIPPKPTWSCKIKDQTYYNYSSAQNEWRSMVHTAVDDVYTKLLERKSNQNDYNYWESKIPFNGCNFYVNPQTIWDEVKNSDERKNLLVKKEENKKIAGTAVNDDQVNPPSSKENNTWLWWLLGTGGATYGIIQWNNYLKRKGEPK